MKKGKFLALGLIVLMLAGGLALASCGGGGKCNYYDGACYITFHENYDNSFWSCLMSKCTVEKNKYNESITKNVKCNC